MDQTTNQPTARRTSRPASSRVRSRLAGVLLALGLGFTATLVTASPADAMVRLGNGAYGSYGLDCTGYRSARLTVQGGANGIPVNQFRYWVYSVDSGQYVVSGAWVANGPAWNATTITVPLARGQYNVYVEYWSYSGGQWYAGGEWTWAKNLLQPTMSQNCRIL